MAVVQRDATAQDPTAFRVTFTLVVFGTECVSGILGNGFIAAVYGAEWVRNKRLPTADGLMLMLSSSRLALQIWLMVTFMFRQSFQDVYYRKSLDQFFRITLLFLNYANLWLAAWLNVFYCLKIASFAQPLFLMLKKNIGVLMPRLVCLSLLVSSGMCSLFFINTFNTYVNSSIPVTSANTTVTNIITETNVVNLSFFYYLGICIPLLLFLTAATLLILSLKRHTLHMKSGATGSRDPSMEAHWGAIKSTSWFLILYVINALAIFINIASIFDIYSPWDIVCRFIMAAYPTSHSVQLILCNPGLRRTWKRYQHRVLLYLRG
ncbi:taste receptor type 2 member 40 [Octodon degus]|uniref:Taste receptor type 2 n=1 Tax=Octodon degus TaxID=10160 RepID=A0A6P3F459_OCTDE|nr:taste receptor type 2 member 40 [Octodon degus]